MKRSLLLLLLLAGCAGPEASWVQPNVGNDQRSQDYFACRRTAELQAGIDTRRFDEPRPGDPFREYDRGKAVSQMSMMMAQCMIGKGYMRASS